MGYVISQLYYDPEIGNIKIVARRNATRFIARWKGPELQVTVPYGISVEQFNQALNKLRADIIRKKPKSRYYDGQQFDFDGFSILIKSEILDKKSVIRAIPAEVPAKILVSDDLDFANEWVEKKISEDICYIARAYAHKTVILLAEEVSKQLGVYPKEYCISNGARTLGRCHRDGRIDLSSRLALLPVELRKYVICHELAHLREMNHSPRFHKIVNEYTGGREAELQKQIRTFSWPIIK
jgi:hypothetical protein